VRNSLKASPRIPPRPASSIGHLDRLLDRQLDGGGVPQS